MATSKLSSRYRTFSPTFLQGRSSLRSRVPVPTLLGPNMKNKKELLLRFIITLLSVGSLASFCIVIVLNNMIENASGGIYGLANSLSSCNDTNGTSSLPIELYHKTIHISLMVFCSIFMLLVILAIIYQMIVIILQSCQINFKYLYSTDICISVFLMSAFIFGSIVSFFAASWLWGILVEGNGTDASNKSNMIGLIITIFIAFCLFIAMYNCYFVTCILTVSKVSKDRFKKQLLEEQLQTFINN
ncbi:PREDICTED: uncharacterized protein LOC109586978 [Amphimedon queenslandica]|uniref:Uncharacterized protein n=1 Tax=Amphimedon queenslandica TaxID=400682 RepID=A0AAN0JPJ6_AMPQE|nr:PREDICTED: uncharacterized protein LOC109586978 [Amphimedon queenslandica]|eukprot:XP_019858752.1 PREDICTED: uncharacterized protein LOC109586978 [Amphimedon queenslandica]